MTQFQDTQPAPVGGDQDLSEFRLSGPVEVRALLKSLMDRNVLLHISGSNGAAYTSTLWSMDTAQNKIALSADHMAPAVQALVESEEAVAVGYLDQIKVQFEINERVLIHGQQACVLQASLPREIYRFQRRSAFRVRTLERSAPTASFRHPQMPEMMVELRVLDVSVGGCALFLPQDVPALEPGVTLNGVKLHLDADTEFRASVVVHHVTAIQPQSRGVRLGCELIQLDPAATRALQRYIDQPQKRRRMLSLD